MNLGSFVSDENPPPDRYTKFREKAPQKAGTYTYTMSMWDPPGVQPERRRIDQHYSEDGYCPGYPKLSTHKPGGALNFFSGRGVRPGFPKCGACERTFASEKGGLWAENFQIWRLVSWKFQIWRLVSWKFPNLGACELKFGWKLRLFRLKFQNFLKRGSCELTLLLEMGPLRAAGEAWKGGLQGRTSPYPLSRSVPPPPRAHKLIFGFVLMNFPTNLMNLWKESI